MRSKTPEREHLLCETPVNQRVDVGHGVSRVEGDEGGLGLLIGQDCERRHLAQFAVELRNEAGQEQ